MHFFSALCFILVSSNASAVSGSSIRGAGLEQDQEKHQSIRNLGLRSQEAINDNVSQNAMDDTVNDLFRQVEDEVYDLLADSYTELSDEINDALLGINPDLDEEGLAHAREAVMDFLEEDSDVPDTPIDASLSFEDLEEDDEEDEQEEEDSEFLAGNDSLELVRDEPDDNGSIQRGRSWGRTSYRKYGHKGCRNSHGGKGSSHYDYDLYRHVSKSYCQSKCGNHCYGYEYSSYERKCEIWKVPIKHVEYVHGLDCYIKK